MKGKIPQKVEGAKAVGFKVLLVVVKLLDEWKYAVTRQEL